MPTPFCMMRTRSASKPRMTGRDALGPKLLAATPGRLFKVSPRVASRLRDNSRPLNMETGKTMASELTPSGLPVTATLDNSSCVMGSAQADAMARLMANASLLGLKNGCAFARLGAV